MSNNVIGTALDEIYRWFDILNQKYYNGALEVPVLTIQKGRANNLGWFTLNKVWNPSENTEDGTNPEKYEINITAENLNRSVEEVVGTLHHEMVHYVNCIFEIKDCNGQVHNKKFRDAAESRGLVCEKNKKYGYGLTTLSTDLRSFIQNEVKPDASVFLYFRNPPLVVTPEKPKKIFKYKCPNCGTEVKGKEGLAIKCIDCDIELEMEDKD